MNTGSISGKILNIAKLIFTPAALAFLVYIGWQSRAELESILAEASTLHLALAMLVWCLFNALTPMLAVAMLNACGSKVGWWQAFSTHASRLPARYMPGGIWHTVGRVIDYNQQGVQTRHLTAFVLLENVLAAGVALTLGGAIVFLTRPASMPGNIALVACLASVLALAVFRKVLNRRVLQQPDGISCSNFISGLGLMIAIWAIATASFLLYVNAFSNATGSHTQLEVAGVYLFSWGVGFLAVFAPQGIGVFELISSELLRGPIGTMGLAALLAGFRLIVLLADLAVWALYLVLRTLRNDEH